MLNRGRHGHERILSRPSVELMATDQLKPQQKAASSFFENFWDSRGWGLGVSIVTPREDMVGVFMSQCRPGALQLPAVVRDFWTSAYRAIDD